MDNRNSICGVPFAASGDGATEAPFRLPRKRDQDEIDGPWERARGAGITFFSLEVTRGERGDRPPATCRLGSSGVRRSGTTYLAGDGRWVTGRAARALAPALRGSERVSPPPGASVS